MLKLRVLRFTALLILLATLSRAEDTANRYPFAAGTIQKLDPNARLLIILTSNGPQTLAFTDRTYMFRAGEKITSDKLKIGDLIKINYYTNETGRAFVRRLKVAPAPPAEQAATR